MLTKKVGGEEDDELDEKDRVDVVQEYKNPEGTAAERLAIHNAVRGSARAQRYYEYNENIKEDCTFDLVELESINVGDDFQVKVRWKDKNIDN